MGRTSACVAIGAFFFPRAIAILGALGDRNTRVNVVSAGFHFHVHRVMSRRFPGSFFSVVVKKRSMGRTGPSPRNVGGTLHQLRHQGDRALCVNSDAISTRATRTTGMSFMNILGNVAAHRRLVICPRQRVLSGLSLLPLVRGFAPCRPSGRFPRGFFCSSYFPGGVMTFCGLLRRGRVEKGRRVGRGPAYYIYGGYKGAFRKGCYPRYKRGHRAPHFAVQGTFRGVLDKFFGVSRNFDHGLVRLLCQPKCVVQSCLGKGHMRCCGPFRALFILTTLCVVNMRLVSPTTVGLSRGRVRRRPAVTDLVSSVGCRRRRASSDYAGCCLKRDVACTSDTR